MPSIGKTTLAVNIAYEYKDKYPDAQLYIDCYGYTAGQTPLTKEKILVLLMLALEIPITLIPDSFEERLMMWQSLLSKMRSIIIFDNISSEKQIRQLMPQGASESLVLITSRKQLLDIPEVDSIRLDVLDEESAIQLLYHVSEKSGEQYKELFRQVVKRCEYLPYAITIFGRRIKNRESIGYIERYIAALKDTETNLQKIGAVYDSFQTSYDLLKQEEKEILKSIGISPCLDMTPATCAAILCIQESVAADLLDTLYDNRLVLETGNDRYRLHDLMRDFARDKYRNEDKAPFKNWIHRLFDFYKLETASANAVLYPNTINVNVDYLDKTKSNWPQWLEDEKRNLETFLEFLYTTKNETEYIELAHLLAAYYRNYLLGEDVIRISENAVCLAKKGENRYYKALSLIDLALANENVGNFTTSIDLFHQAEDLLNYEKSAVELAFAYSNEGFTLERLGEYKKALDILQKAHDIYEQKDDFYGIGFVKNAMGAVNWRMKNYEKAKDIFIEALDIRSRNGDRLGISSTENNLGFTYLKLHENEKAKDLFDDSLAISKEYNDAHGQSVTINNLGYYSIEIKEYTQACLYAQDARVIAERVGNKYQIARSYDVEGKAEFALEDTLNAKNSLEKALNYFKELEVPEYEETIELLKKIDNKELCN